MFFQPFGGDFSVRMIVQGAVYAGDGLYILEYGADVVADQHDGAFTVDVFQQGIEFGFKPLVDVCIGFIQDNQLRARYDGPSQQSPLELSAAGSVRRSTDRWPVVPALPVPYGQWFFLPAGAVRR